MQSKKAISLEWTATLMDAGDGSGDKLLELPDDLMKQMGLRIGDLVTVDVSEDKSTLIVRKYKERK